MFFEEYPDAELYMKTEPIQQVQHFISTTKLKKKKNVGGVETEQESDFYRRECEWFTSGHGFGILGCGIISFLERSSLHEKTEATEEMPINVEARRQRWRWYITPIHDQWGITYLDHVST